MKDIKFLYLNAKNSKSDSAIKEYSEAVNQMFESDPINYITNLKYIIESSIGLKTFKPFVERYGISVTAFDHIHSCFESCIERCKEKNKDTSLYEENLSMLDDFYNKYSNCFHMYEYFSDELNEKYPTAYYGISPSTGIQMKKLAAGMIQKFGEGAIPDAIITADQLGGNAINQIFKYLKEYVENKTMAQWITECSKDVAIFEDNEHLKPIIENNLDTAYNNIKEKESELFRESVVNENEDAIYEYTEEDIHVIEDSISFKEYMITAVNENDIHPLQEQVASLYSELDGLLVESVADSVISMLPFANISYHHDSADNSTVFGKKDITGYPEEKKVQTDITPEEDEYDQRKKTSNYKKNKSFTESTWMNNTRNKKTGEAPGYLKNNHDLGYGEDDNTSSNNDEMTLDDFKRPSVSKSEDEKDTKPESDDLDLDDDNNSVDDKVSADDVAENNRQAINNYYYYNYQNSMNRNSNSFNKDSYNRKDDHSSNKGNNRDNIANENNDGKPESDDFHESVLFTEGKLNLKDTFKLFDVEFKIPSEVNRFFDRHSKQELTEKIKEKAYQNIVKCLNDSKKVKSIENQILNAEREIGQKDDTDDLRIERIKKYLSNAKCEELMCTNNGKISGFKIDIPYIKDTPCAWLEHELWITSDGKASTYDNIEFLESVCEELNEDIFTEANDGKPESDHPVRDTLMDIDKDMTKVQQSAKKKVQDVQNVGRVITKPINRTKSWITNMIMNWKDADENRIKEKMADPHARKNLYSAIKKAISIGALAQAGILFNPIFLFLSVTKKFTTNRNMNRIRSEMIGEIKTELEILDEKINDARMNHDDKQKYQMMRMKNELTKKLLRVGGSPLNNENHKVFGVSKLI